MPHIDMCDGNSQFMYAKFDHIYSYINFTSGSSFQLRGWIEMFLLLLLFSRFCNARFHWYVPGLAHEHMRAVQVTQPWRWWVEMWHEPNKNSGAMKVGLQLLPIDSLNANGSKLENDKGDMSY